MSIDCIIEYLGLEKETGAEYLKEALNIIKRKKLKPKDINLSLDIVPTIARKFNVSYSAVDSACRRSLKRSFYRTEENKKEYKFLYNAKTYLTLSEFLKKSVKYVSIKQIRKTKKK